MAQLRIHMLDARAAAGARRLEEQPAQARFGLLFTVIRVGGSSESDSRKRRTASSLLEQAVAASRTAKRASGATGLPVALATYGLEVNVSALNFDRTFAIGTRWQGRSIGRNVWRDRLAAIANSPFDLTLSLDSSVTVCAGSRLYHALRWEHSQDRLDFAVNFESSPLVDARSAAASATLFGGRFPGALEEVLPHNFAMLARKGSGTCAPPAPLSSTSDALTSTIPHALCAGLKALLALWSSQMDSHADDQVALRLVFQRLAAVEWRAVGRWCLPIGARDLARRSALALGSELGASLVGRASKQLCTQIRVMRLKDNLLGLKVGFL